MRIKTQIRYSPIKVTTLTSDKSIKWVSSLNKKQKLVNKTKDLVKIQFKML